MRKTQEYCHVAIAPQAFDDLKKAVKNLNDFAKKFGKPFISEQEIYEKIHKTTAKNKKTQLQSKQKLEVLTYKMFVEAAISYFVKHKIDPRFYDDRESLTHQFIRFRNQNFAFLQTMESEFILPRIEELSKLLKTIQTQEISPKMEEIRALVKNIESLGIENYATIETTLTTMIDLQEFESSEEKAKIIDKISEKLNRRSQEVTELLKGKQS